MTTLGDIVNDVLVELHGQTADLEQITFLTVNIGTTDIQYTVDDASQLSRGLVEVDDELMWVTRIDQTNNIVYIAPFGRGYRGTVAASHASGTQIMNNPRFPRGSVVQKIQQTQYEIYPEIFAIMKDESNLTNPVVTTYPVPANCDIIIRARYQTIGPSMLWEPIRRYDLNQQANVELFPTGKTIDIGDRMFPGRPIQITYLSRPTQLVNDTDVLTDTGLDDNVRDVLMYGACYRLVAGLEVAKLQAATVEQGYDRGTYVGTTGAATAGSKYYLSLFQERMANERMRLLQLYPTVTHLTR